MNKILAIIVSAIWLISAGCGAGAGGEAGRGAAVSYRSTNAVEAELQETIASYFRHFDDIRRWRAYSTEDFVKRVYFWCTGDASEQKSVEEMVSAYYELNKLSLKLRAVEVQATSVVGEHEVVIDVVRTWEDGSRDETAYSILRQDGEWKIDNRM